jgi:hypothetical protein
VEAGSAYPTGAPMFTSRFLSGVRVARPLVFYVVFSRSLVFFSFGNVFVRPSSILFSVIENLIKMNSM